MADSRTVAGRTAESSDWYIQVQDPPASEVVEGLRACLTAHNEATLDRRRGTAPLAWVVREAGGRLVAGLLAEYAWSWLYVQVLWINADRRGQGLGRALMAAAETWTREAGGTGILVETADFQAPDFYRRVGFSVFGEVPDLPPGSRTYFLLRRLNDGT